MKAKALLEKETETRTCVSAEGFLVLFNPLISSSTAAHSNQCTTSSNSVNNSGAMES